MRFVKMHGIGNDYVYLDAVTDPSIEQRPDLPELARRISHRHTGVGSDGLILICRPRPGVTAHARMRMFNADGSESEMCGNGIRCVAKFVHDRLGIVANPMLIETGRGVLSIDYTLAGGKLAQATVDMGEPILELERIPVDRSHLVNSDMERNLHGLRRAKGWEWSFVSMGNPHAVGWEEHFEGDSEREKTYAERHGRGFEVHPAFPRRTNVHFVVRVSPNEARMATWERGAGLTQACGTGACAVLVAGVLSGRLEREALIHLPGGDLTIRWDEKTNHVFMTGPAADVFEGDWPQA